MSGSAEPGWTLHLSLEAITLCNWKATAVLIMESVSIWECWRPGTQLWVSEAVLLAAAQLRWTAQGKDCEFLVVPSEPQFPVSLLHLVVYGRQTTVTWRGYGTRAQAMWEPESRERASDKIELQWMQTSILLPSAETHFPKPPLNYEHSGGLNQNLHDPITNQWLDPLAKDQNFNAGGGLISKLWQWENKSELRRGAGATVQRTRTLDGSHENLSLDLQPSRKKSVVAMQVCKPRAAREEGEAGGITGTYQQTPCTFILTPIV